MNPSRRREVAPSAGRRRGEAARNATPAHSLLAVTLKVPRRIHSV